MTNYDKIKAHFQQHQKRMEEREHGWWSPENDGVYVIRVLPPWAGADVWYKEYSVHYMDDPKTGDRVAITCPKQTIQSLCPLCDFVRGLWKTKAEDDKVMASAIRAKARSCANIVLADAPGEVKIYGFGEKVLNQLRRQQVGDSSGVVLPFEDAEKGFYIDLDKKTKIGQNGNKYPEYLAMVQRMPSPLKDKTVLQRLNNLDEVISRRIKSATEIAAYLSGEVSAADFMAAKTLLGGGREGDGAHQPAPQEESAPTAPPVPASDQPAATPQPAAAQASGGSLEETLRARLKGLRKP